MENRARSDLDMHLQRDTVPLSVPLMRPDTYDGQEPWEQYLSCFEDCAELGHWDLRSKVLILSASLRGPARTFYMSLDPAERRSYDDLVKKMQLRFGSNDHPSKWIEQLEHRQREPGESMVAWCDVLRQLVKKAFPTLDSHAQEAIALNQLYKLIPLQMKCRCLDKECQNVWEAASVVERYETILGYQSDNRPTPNLTPADTTLSKILERLISRIENLERVAETSKPPPSSQDKRQRHCFRCDSTNHLIGNCTEKPYRTGHYGFRRHNKSDSDNWRQRHPPSEKQQLSEITVSCEPTAEPETIPIVEPIPCQVATIEPRVDCSSQCKADPSTASTNCKKSPANRQSVPRYHRANKHCTPRTPDTTSKPRFVGVPVRRSENNTLEHSQYDVSIPDNSASAMIEHSDVTNCRGPCPELRLHDQSDVRVGTFCETAL